MKRLNLGSGLRRKEGDGWINIDYDEDNKPDIVRDIIRGLPFEDSCVDEILISHVLEHVKKEDFYTIFEDRLNVMFMRTDKEHKDITFDFDGFDLVCDPIYYCPTFKDWVNLHAKCRTITTNRCHSAILGMIFNKQVVLFPNIYFKNMAIWEYSLKDKVRFYEQV